MRTRIDEIHCPLCNKKTLELDIGVSLTLESEAVFDTETKTFKVDKPVMIPDDGIYEIRSYCNNCGWGADEYDP